MLENALITQKRVWLGYYFTLGCLLFILALGAGPWVQFAGYIALAVTALIKFITDIRGAQKLPSEEENRAFTILQTWAIDIIPTLAVFILASLTATSLSGIIGGTIAESFFTIIAQTATPIGLTAIFALAAFNALLNFVYHLYQWASLRFSDDANPDQDYADPRTQLSQDYNSFKKSALEFIILAGIAVLAGLAFFTPFAAINIPNFALLLATGFVIAALFYIQFGVPCVDSDASFKQVSGESPFASHESTPSPEASMSTSVKPTPSPEEQKQVAQNEIDTHLQQGKRYFDAKDYKNAVNEFDSAYKQNQNLRHDQTFLLLYGPSLYYSGKYDRAIPIFSFARRQAPSDQTLLTFYGQSLYYSGNYPDALTVFIQLGQVNNNNPEYAKGAGQTLFKLQRYGEALPFFQWLTGNDANDYVAWNNLGKTLLQLEKRDEALTAFKKSFELQSPSDAKNSLGQLISQLEHQAASTATTQESASQNTFQP